MSDLIKVKEDHKTGTFNRRQFLTLLGLAGMTLLTGQAKN